MTKTSGQRQELLAILSLLAGVFVALTLLPWDITGPVGRVAGGFLWRWFGLGAALIPVLGIGVGLAGFDLVPRLDLERVAVLFAGLILLAPYAVAILTGATGPGDFPPAYEDWTVAQKLSGLLPVAVAVGISEVIGTAGAIIIGLGGLWVLTVYTLEWHPFAWVPRGWARVVEVVRQWKGRKASQERDRSETAEAMEALEDASDATAAPAVPPKKLRKRKRPPEQTELPIPDGPSVADFPPVDLLTSPEADDGHTFEDAIERQGQVLIDTLRTFKVEGKIIGRTTGPVVTQYEVAPAPGVKVGRIAALADDLALAMRAQSVRIVAPIPGRGAVGVEVPNPSARIVTLRELLETPDWNRARGILPVALGRNLEGKPIVADLAKMPHLLIAGATGSGKSICINTIITSLIYRYSPQDLRMLMIDPKMVELSLYNALPHLRHPVVTRNREAAQVLKWAMWEMDRRYQLFHANGARGIVDFNRYVDEGRELELPVNGERGRGKGADGEQLDIEPGTYAEGRLPYVVLIVDELADLMMTVQGEVEKPLAILAQKARATGVHIIIATQRPSVNVITGLIKANFPCRIAFRVASKVDSRTILDQNGAEALLGNGDGLFIPPGKSEPLRIQGAFISTDETEALTRWYADRKAELEAEREAEGRIPEPEEDILEVVQQIEEAEPTFQGAEEPEDRDPLFRDAAEVCIGNQGGSTSLLQRKLKIGYGRAARIMDQLEEAGILGPSEGAKGREVLIGMEQIDQYS
jgi:S-DNA-T family DNA segregation ATPase FtsK/SpoIIIE